MTNTELLDKKIKDEGKKKSHLAKKCNLSLQGFRNCMVNKAEWKAGQIVVLCEELNIGLDTVEMLEIFFSPNGA